MANVIVGQLLQNGLFWGAACSTLFAVPEYIRWGKAAPPSTSPWFWTASEHNHTTPQLSSQTVESYISTLVQEAPTVTITIPTTITTTKQDITTITTTQKDPVTATTGTSEPITITTTKTLKVLTATSWRTTTTVSKTTRTSYIPSITFTELKTVFLYKTNTQTYSQQPSTGTITKHTEITTTSKVRPTFTKTVTEIAGATETIYSDAASPASNISDWLENLILWGLAVAVAALASYRYGSWESRKRLEGNRIETERMQKEIAEEYEEMLQNRESAENEKERVRQQISQIERDAEAKVVEASVDLKALKGMLKRLKSAIEELDDYEVTDFELRDDENFERCLEVWKSKRNEMTDEVEQSWLEKMRQKKQDLAAASFKIEWQDELVKQMKDQLTALGQEKDVQISLLTDYRILHNKFEAQANINVELRAKIFEFDQQNILIREKNAKLLSDLEETVAEKDELWDEISQYETQIETLGAELSRYKASGAEV